MRRASAQLLAGLAGDLVGQSLETACAQAGIVRAQEVFDVFAGLLAAARCQQNAGDGAGSGDGRESQNNMNGFHDSGNVFL